MNTSFVQLSHADWLSILPEVALASAGCLILLLEAFLPSLRRWFATLALAGVAASLYFLMAAPPGTTFDGRFETSPLTWLMGLFLGGSAAVAILVAKPYLERAGDEIQQRLSVDLRARERRRASSTRCCSGATSASRS